MQGGGGHPNKFASVLLGGVTVYCKPASAVNDGGVAARNEVAAWEAARLLEWTDLIAATAFRPVYNPFSGATEDASVQVMWPGLDWCPPLASFAEHDVFRAAVYDYLIAHTDRGSGQGGANNWIGVPPGATSPQGPAAPPQLKLIDHGFAFDYPNRVATSAFTDARRGGLIPPPYAFAVTKLVGEARTSRLPELLEPASLTLLLERAAALVRAGQIP